MDRDVKVNSLIELLSRYEPGVLDALRETYLGQKEILSLGVTLGQGSAEIAVLVDLVEQSIPVLRNRIASNTNFLRKKIKKARTLRLISSLLAAILSAGILALVGWERYLAVMTLACTVFTLLSEYVESSPIHGEEKSPMLLVERLISFRVEVENIEGQLKLYKILKPDQNTLVEMVLKTNVLAANTIEIEEKIGTLRD